MKLYNTEWIDIFTNMRAESMADDWEPIKWTIAIVSKDEEMDDGQSVHDIYYTTVEYDEYLTETLEDLQEQASDNERLEKTYKTSKGLHNWLKNNMNNTLLDAVIIH